MIISSGPLQGLTDSVYRNTHHEVWGGIDAYFGPYLRLDTHKDPKPGQIRDIESPLNSNINYIPQLMGNNPDLLLDKIQWLKGLGYRSVNWNLGCPYPMVTKRSMGAGLINQPELVDEILNKIMLESPLEFSIKCRIGFDDDQEIVPLLKVFNKYKLKEIIIHARTASQLYKGHAKPEKLIPIIENSANPIAYNGDINSLEDFKKVQELFESNVSHFMLGRGLLKQPWLAQLIKGDEMDELEIKENRIKFHNKLIEQYGKKLQDHQLLMKMRGFWEYYSHAFSNQHKAFKLIKKSGNIKKYHVAVNRVFQDYGEFKK